MGQFTAQKKALFLAGEILVLTRSHVAALETPLIFRQLETYAYPLAFRKELSIETKLKDGERADGE